MKYLKHIWGGESPLWKAFWIYFIGGYFTLSAVNLVLAGIWVDVLKLESFEMLTIILFVVLLTFLLSSFIVIKRNSKNSKWRGWIWIAQSVLFLAVIRSFYSLYIVFTKYLPEINQMKNF